MKKGPLKITDFVEPQRTGPSLDTRRAVALHIVTLQRKAADPATPAETAAKSRRLVSNYRARTAKRPAGLRRANAKNMEKLFARVVAHIRCGLREGVLRESANPIVTREAIARYLAVPEHQVEQVFKRLVCEGLLAQRRNDGAHDTTRAWLFTGSYSGWAPTYWYLRNLEWWRQASE